MISGVLVYLINYLIGWALHYRKISMKKITHQAIFIAIILNLTMILFYLPLLSAQFILCLTSLLTMLALPFGKKGGIYHRITASLGIALYVIMFFSFR